MLDRREGELVEIRYVGFDQRQSSRVYRGDRDLFRQASARACVENGLTAADVRAYADAKALADTQRAATRKAPRRRSGVKAEMQQKSPRRNGNPVRAKGFTFEPGETAQRSRTL